MYFYTLCIIYVFFGVCTNLDSHIIHAIMQYVLCTYEYNILYVRLYVCMYIYICIIYVFFGECTNLASHIIHAIVKLITLLINSKCAMSNFFAEFGLFEHNRGSLFIELDTS